MVDRRSGGRSTSPHPPPVVKPKPKPIRLESGPVGGGNGGGNLNLPPRSPQLLATPKQDGRRTVSLSVRQPIITVESPNGSAAVDSGEHHVPPPTASRPLLPPRSATTALASPSVKPPFSPRPIHLRQDEHPPTPGRPQTPPPWSAQVRPYHHLPHHRKCVEGTPHQA